MNLLRAVSTVGAYTIASRVGGFVREILTASFLGVGAATDALTLAIKLPAFFRRLFAEGAFNACFVPLFAGLWAAEGEKDAKTFAEHVLTLLTVVLLLVVLCVELFLPTIIPILLPGFGKTPERLELLIQFTRVTFPFIFFISLTALYGGILNSLDRFTAVASSPMMGNIFIIAAVFALNSHLSTPGYAFAIAVGASGLIQLLWVMVPCWKLGLRLRFSRPRLTPPLRKFFTNMGPAALGSGVIQINLFMGAFIASWLPVGSITYLNFADRLNQLPLSVIGIAISTALLPLLSRQLRTGTAQEVHESQMMAIEFSLFLTFPAMLALIFLAQPLVMILFEHGAFTSVDTKQTAQTLAAYACGLPAYVMVKILSTRFFAAGDTRTPLMTGALSILVDIGLSILLMNTWRHIGIAFATSAAAWVNVIALAIILLVRQQLVMSPRLIRFIPRLIAACFATVMTLQGFLFLLSPFLIGEFTQKVFAVVTLVLGGLTAFLLLAKWFGAVNYKEMRRMFSTPPSSAPLTVPLQG